MNPTSWVIGFLTWEDIAQLCPRSALSEMLVPRGGEGITKVIARGEGPQVGGDLEPGNA